MKRLLLLPLLLGFTPAVNAESVWLVLSYSLASGKGTGFAAMEKIEMKNMTECNQWKEEWSESWKWRSAWCIPGK